MHEPGGICSDYTVKVSATLPLGLWGILMACTLPPWMPWSQLAVISLRTGARLTCAALLSPAWSHSPSWGLGSSPWARAPLPSDTSWIYFLDAVCLEAFPLPFLLISTAACYFSNIFKVTLLTLKCWELEGKMQELCNLILQHLEVQVSTVN